MVSYRHKLVQSHIAQTLCNRATEVAIPKSTERWSNWNGWLHSCTSICHGWSACMCKKMAVQSLARVLKTAFKVVPEWNLYQFLCCTPNMNEETCYLYFPFVHQTHWCTKTSVFSKMKIMILLLPPNCFIIFMSANTLREKVSIFFNQMKNISMWDVSTVLISRTVFLSACI